MSAWYSRGGTNGPHRVARARKFAADVGASDSTKLMGSTDACGLPFFFSSLAGFGAGGSGSNFGSRGAAEDEGPALAVERLNQTVSAFAPVSVPEQNAVLEDLPGSPTSADGTSSRGG